MARPATPHDPDRRASAVAGRQHGVLSLAQARAAGLSQRQVDGRVAAGRWRRVARGIYVVEGAPASWRQRAWAAQLANGPDAVLSHLTAGAVLALTQPSLLPHVTVPRGSATRSGTAVVHRSAVPAVDRAAVEGLRITGVARTLVDLAALLDGVGLSEAIDAALCRKLTTPEAVLAAADRVGGGRRGLAHLRSTLAVWTEGIEPGSVAEVRLLRLLQGLGVVDLVTQHEVHDQQGRFVARLDLACPSLRRGFEYDGVRHHGPRAWARDERRYAVLRETGWIVHDVSKLDLLPGEPRLRNLVRAWGTSPHPASAPASSATSRARSDR